MEMNVFASVTQCLLALAFPVSFGYFFGRAIIAIKKSKIIGNYVEEEDSTFFWIACWGIGLLVSALIGLLVQYAQSR